MAENMEFITAHTRRSPVAKPIGPGHLHFENARDAFKHLVARRMSQRIVDRLETIKIQGKDKCASQPIR